METEIWKDIPNYEGKYQCSNLGNVKSFLQKNGILRKRISRGYDRVALYDNGVSKQFSVHQLVAICFFNHKLDGTMGLVINHINGNKSDNRADNIEVITQRENVQKHHIKTKKTSQYVGVYFDKQRKKWSATINIKDKQFALGRFKTEIEAYDAYINKINAIS